MKYNIFRLKSKGKKKGKSRGSTAEEESEQQHTRERPNKSSPCSPLLGRRNRRKQKKQAQAASNQNSHGVEVLHRPVQGAQSDNSNSINNTISNRHSSQPRGDRSDSKSTAATLCGSTTGNTSGKAKALLQTSMMKRHGSIETNANTSNSNNTKSTHKSRDQSKDGPGNGPFPTGSGGPSSSSSSKIKKPLSLSSRPQNSNRSKTHKSGAPKDSHGSVDDHASARMYDSIPPLEVTTLPRGGISIETEAVGRIQFGIPPETIKDSMLLGINVPLYYIVPVERFCREMGPALGVNLAEFEFPAYFNFFVQKARCTLIVDSEDAERNIRRVFSETLLGPAQFRRKENPIRYDPEDFAPDFSREAIPDFEKELKHFRVMPDGQELVLEKLLNFCHFEHPFETRTHENLGVPPPEPIDAKISSDKDNAAEKKSRSSAYSRMKLCAEVAVLYPNNASQKDIAKRTCKRVEIFKMQGGEEYVLHDINENNIIVGKSRFSGNVRVSESMSVHGFGDQGDSNIEDYMQEEKTEIPKSILPPTFHPPSFGVTVLGNSHGFDKSGSVSGYVLWINGRGVMIDPPPYSSATLEREGIRPRTIVGIILTHCHADHDAGAFQKVLTGSPVVVITTPTIYKSFIRKYAALSNLSPALLRHCHRHKPAIIGAPLRFQGATFQFTYTLHSIPCVGFRVEWRGRSMVFTGDHFNSPPDIDKLQDSGVLAAARADDLRNLPLQETDLLLHEAGVPPLHTPLDVLLKLPQEVKRRLYVVHTQALPPGCELRVAPTGTAGTIRLDENSNTMATRRHTTSLPPKVTDKLPYEDELAFQSMWSSSEYESFGEIVTSSAPQSRAAPRSSINSYSMVRGRIEPPPVALRPTSTTDSWFLLNLLSAVPFLSGLSYASTMEVLETARVDAFCINEVVVHASRRSEVLCVVWEGTCTERPATKLIAKSTSGKSQSAGKKKPTASSTSTAVWHAGDWTGPISLQPEKHLSGESNLSSSHDVVAMSQQGVKVIIIEFASLHKILKSGSLLYRTYLRRKKDKEMTVYDHIPDCLEGATNKDCFINDVRNLEILELLKYNTTLRKLSAVQKRHLESLAEGPVYFKPGQRLWRSGTAVEKAYMIVGGTVSFVAKRRNAGSAGVGISSRDFNSADSPKNEFDDFSSIGSSIGEMMRQDAAKVRLELEEKNKGDHDDNKLGNPSADDDLSYQSSISSDSDVSLDMNKETGDFALCPAISMQDSVRSAGSSVYNLDYERLNISLQKRADNLGSGKSVNRRDSESSGDYHSQISIADNSTEDGEDVGGSESDTKATRRRSSRDRNANRQLNRLYNRRAFTAGLVFSKGHFLGDISKMVAGLLSSTYQGQNDDSNGDDNSAKYGFGEKNEGNPNSRGGHIGEMTIHEQEGDQHIVHSSTLAAGKDGCVVLVFPKPSLILFLDEYPGLLLSLLGTQVVL